MIHKMQQLIGDGPAVSGAPGTGGPGLVILPEQFTVNLFGLGQSNWEGSTNGIEPTAEYRQTFTNVKFGDSPINYDTNYTGSKFGFDLSLAKEFNTRHPNSELYIQKEAVSGVGLAHWQDPQNLQGIIDSYGASKTRVAGKPNVKNIFLLVHGENAAINASETPTYYSDLTGIVNALENAHGAFDAYIINYLPEIPAARYDFWVREQCIKYVSERANAKGWDMNKYTHWDGVHYTTDSYYAGGPDLLDIIETCYK